MTFPEGTTLLDMVPAFFPEGFGDYPIIAAKVNNVCQGLKYRAFNSRQVEFIDYTSYAGRSVYCSSLCFLLCKAAKDVFPQCSIVLRRPISKGYFCALDKGDGSQLVQADLDAVSARMKELVDADMHFRRHEVRTEEAIDLFTNLGYDDKVSLLETSGDVYVNYYTLDGTPDYYYEALLPSTGYLKVWGLDLYRGGILLRVPDRHKPEDLAPFIEQPKTFEVFSENLRWNKIMGLDNVGDGVCLATLHTINDGGLDALVGSLLGGGFLLCGVLLRQQLHLVLDELLLGRGQRVVVQNLLEHLCLGGFLNICHSINSFRFLGLEPVLDYI